MTLAGVVMGFIGGPTYYIIGQIIKKFTQFFIILGTLRFFMVIGVFLLVTYYPVKIISRGLVIPIFYRAAKY